MEILEADFRVLKSYLRSQGALTLELDKHIDDILIDVKRAVRESPSEKA